ncbi:MAG: phosphoribosylamine--glycine ligase [Siphonobacter sp.]
MNILIVGSGGREHAFAWKIAQSPLCQNLYVAPGNAGTAQLATNLPIGVNDFESIATAVLEHHISLVIVGPEEPLVRGIRDYFEIREDLKKVLVLGPDRRGAQLEGSKDFSKNFMQKYGVPTAASRTFTAETLEEGLSYLENQVFPIVLKADGLAAGKGVIIATTIEEAQTSLKEMLIESKFGEASRKVVIEEYLHGIEVSLFVLTDGENYVILPEAKDYKRIGEGDTGPNTGGMGAVSPVPFADDAFLKKVDERIVQPTLSGLRAEGIRYIGFIFVGLMNVKGDPYVIEYNCRMGDPETEVVLPRIDSDLLMLLKAAAEGKLKYVNFTVSNKTAVTTVVVAGGYPGDYAKGQIVQVPEKQNYTTIFHAGTTRSETGQVLTNGGRVMAITALGASIEEARQRSQSAASMVSYEGKYYRRDIGLDLL